MTVRDTKDLGNLKSYILLNTVTAQEDGNEIISKELLNASSLASKSDVLTLEEQHTKLVNIIQGMLNKMNTLEAKLAEGVSHAAPTIQTTPTIQNDITSILENIQNKLNDSTLEL